MRIPSFLSGRPKRGRGDGAGSGAGGVASSASPAGGGAADVDGAQSGGIGQRLADFRAVVTAMAPRDVSVLVSAWAAVNKARRDTAWEQARSVTKDGGVPLAKPSAEVVTFVQRWAGRRPDGMSKETWAREKPVRGQAVPPLIAAGVALVLDDRLDPQSSATLLTAWRAAERLGRGSGEKRSDESGTSGAGGGLTGPAV